VLRVSVLRARLRRVLTHDPGASRRGRIPRGRARPRMLARPGSRRGRRRRLASAAVRHGRAARVAVRGGGFASVLADTRVSRVRVGAFLRRGRRRVRLVARRLGEQRRLRAERVGEVSGEVGERTRRVPPLARGVAPHEPPPVHQPVPWLDDHVRGGRDVADGPRSGEPLGEEHLHRDVVLDALVVNRHRALRAQQPCRPPVVVRERVVAHAQRGVPLRVVERGRRTTGREDRDVGRARGESRAETSATWKEPTF
jgi:hypothetical protein